MQRWEREYDCALAAGDVAREVEEARRCQRQRQGGARECVYAHVWEHDPGCIFCEENNDYEDEDFCRYECDLWSDIL
ncbi:MAG: hypothetical protein IJ113_03425 [Eggerthellaceae bacterium]|nr:hypothetical protein [Eggerthellaceae bacterium]